MGFREPTSGDAIRIFDLLRNGAIGNLVLVVAGAIPGSLAAIFLVDKIGRKSIQLLGFTMITILLFILGSAFDSMSDSSRVALFVLILFFVNFGPNSTTFIVPGECFPTRYRSTCHGMAAASGKLGAVLAQALTGPLRDIGYVKGQTESYPWLPHVIQILAGFAFLGWLCTWLIPETMGSSLEKLAGEEPHGLDDEDQPSNHPFQQYAWFDLWSQCTPFVLFKWLASRRGQGKESGGLLDTSPAPQPGERIGLSKMGVVQEMLAQQRPSQEAMLPSPKAGEGLLKVFESEVDRTSGESSNRGDQHSDEIRQVT
jgi:MFS family permease